MHNFNTVDSLYVRIILALHNRAKGKGKIKMEKVILKITKSHAGVKLAPQRVGKAVL